DAGALAGERAAAAVADRIHRPLGRGAVVDGREPGAGDGARDAAVAPVQVADEAADGGRAARRRTAGGLRRRRAARGLRRGRRRGGGSGRRRRRRGGDGGGGRRGRRRRGGCRGRRRRDRRRRQRRAALVHVAGAAGGDRDGDEDPQRKREGAGAARHRRDATQATGGTTCTLEVRSRPRSEPNGWDAPSNSASRGPRGGQGGASDTMSVKYAVLGLLAQRRGYGYDLVQRFEEQVGPAWQLNAGAIYVAHDKLEQEGLVRPIAA